MRQFAGLFWIFSIVTLALSLAGLGFWHMLDLPTVIGLAIGLCALLSVIAILLLEEVRPLQ